MNVFHSQLFRVRLRELIDRHEELSISELGRRIGHKTGTAVSSLLSDAESRRKDLRLSTFMKIVHVLAEAYSGNMTQNEILVFLLDASSERSVQTFTGAEDANY